MKLGEFEEAVAVCERALHILEREGNDESTTILADTHKTMGSLHKTNGHNDGALEHLTRALELLEKVYGSEHPKYATVCKDVAEMLCFTDDEEKLRSAREKAEKAQHVFLHTRGKDHDATVKISCVLGWICSNERQFDAADGHFARVLAYAEKDRESYAPLWKRAHGGRLVNRARRLVDDAGGAQNDAAADAAMEAFAVLDEINRPMAELDAACELRNDRPMPLGRSRRRLTVRLESIDDAPIEQPP